jgi:hypothetical protein
MPAPQLFEERECTKTELFEQRREFTKRTYSPSRLSAMTPLARRPFGAARQPSGARSEIVAAASCHDMAPPRMLSRRSSTARSLAL